jgi:cell surface protein SprA
MLLTKHLKTLTTLLFATCQWFVGFAQDTPETKSTPIDTLQKSGYQPLFRWKDSYLNRFSSGTLHSPLLAPVLNGGTKTTIYFQPDKNLFDVTEQLPEQVDNKPPQLLSFNEYSSIQNAAIRKSILRDYERLQDGNSNISGRGINPSIEKNPVLDRIFGGKIPEFKPNGYIVFGMRMGQTYTANPEIAISQWRQPVFDFDPNPPQIKINFNNMFEGAGQGQQGRNGGLDRNSVPDLGQLDQFGRASTQPLDKFGNIKDKLGILGNFDTGSAFNFENQLRLNYRNEPEYILQSLEAGNVSMPNRTQLIPGVQNLLGVKAGLCFGKLDITTLLANQRSRTESIIINGGNQSRPFEIRCDNYEENQHFFLSQFFRDKYEKSLKNLPMVLSDVRITRVEVYVTNRTNTIASMRNVVGVADLGEAKPYSKAVTSTNAGRAVDNKSNSLQNTLFENKSSFTSLEKTGEYLKTNGLTIGDDFEILRGAKRLTEREYDLNPQLGYISLYTALRNDEILMVAYEYTYKGGSYRVGELSEDYSARKEDEVVVLKMLKSSTLRNRLDNPMWNLMMKNVYSLAQGQMNREGFQLRVIYKDDRTGIDNPNLQEGKNLKNRPLIEALGLDRLNFNNDPTPDGNFDYVENVTVNERQGKIIFPVLEPFGAFLESKFSADEQLLKEKYVFKELYKTTKADAQQINTKNKFFIKGSVQLSSTDIPLPIGASGGSVRVYAGGVELKQGSDYIVDTQLGRIRLTNQSILNSARQIRIDYERPDLFQAQIRRLFGLRFDYTVGKYLRLGGTLMDMKEQTPGLLTRASIGNEPVNNTIWGLDVNLKKDSRELTRFLDKLPFVQTKELSSILLNAEFAQLIPGVNNKRVSGNSMIDDFETVRNINDLTRQASRWRLGATPDNFKVGVDSLGFHFRRAKMSVYTLDPSTFFVGGIGNGGVIVDPDIAEIANANIYERPYTIQNIFKGRSRPVLGQQLPSALLDVAFFPRERGMYNYNIDLFDKNGLFKEPKKTFGAITRGLTFDTDFDNSNVEYLEFWMLNPFKDAVRDGIENKTNVTGGKLTFQLGDVSEDVIPDSYNNFENGLPDGTSDLARTKRTRWGKAPLNQYVTEAFSNSDSARVKQDVGLDGLTTKEERIFFENYLKNAKNYFETEAYNQLENDPSSDDFAYFLNSGYQDGISLLRRYKGYMGMENNAPVIDRNAQFAESNTYTADKEDVNNDNTINDLESYYEYGIDLKPADANGEVNHPLVVDRVEEGKAQWLLFRVPLKDYNNKTDGITGFKSMRFVRMVLSEWEQPVVCRFATLQLVSNQYRVYPYDMAAKGISEVPEPYDAKFKVATANIEENGCDEQNNCNNESGKTPYVVPPGFIRDRDFTQQTLIQFNEQSLSMGVTNLRDGDSRAVFKNSNLDLNMYKRLQLFVHAEVPDVETSNIQPDSTYGAGAFLRLGTDTRENYYEIEIPNLVITPNNLQNPIQEQVWPYQNEIDVPLDVLRNLKIERDTSKFSINEVYASRKIIAVEGFAVNPLTGKRDVPVTRNYRISVVGRPDLSNVLTVMMGLRNPESDDQKDKSFTVWMNELRSNSFDQTRGEAAILGADIKLADLGSISVSGNYMTYGFGGVQDRISMRAREDSWGIGVASNLDLDKFLPQKWGLSIPFFMNFDQRQIIPHFNPLDPDIEMSYLKITNPAEYERIRSKSIDNTVTKGFNFSNVRKIKTDASRKNHFYDLENFTVTYAQNSVNKSNILLQEMSMEQAKGGIGYQYQPKPFTIEPFKKKEFKAGKYAWMKDFNFSPLPTLFAIRTDFDKNFIKTQYRNDELGTENISPNYIRYFRLNRNYDAQWSLSKSLQFTYTAAMLSIIDEPYGEQELPVLKNVFSLGRPKNYKQEMNATWRMPLDKFFLLDWIQADAQYGNQFNYRANSLGIKDEFDQEFGNYIENGRNVGLRGRVDLVKLYNKIKYLKFANTPAPPQRRFTRVYGDYTPLPQQEGKLAKSLTRLLMSVRGINFNYSNVRTSLLPGFLPQSKFFGMGEGFGLEGLPFILGNQRVNDIPTINNGWLAVGEANGWLSRSTERNDPFIQSKQQKFDYNVNLEPFTGFRMQIKGNYSRGDDFSILYRPDSLGKFSGTNPIRNGNLSVSYWSFKSLGKRQKVNDNWQQNDIFDLFLEYRELVATYLNKTVASGSVKKFDVSSQDVMVTAFLAAYGGKGLYTENPLERAAILNEYLGKKVKNDAVGTGENTVAKWQFTNLFKSIPLPNWRIDYSGVEKLPFFKKKFASITLSHSYTSTFNVGNYTSSLNYGRHIDPMNQLGYLIYLSLLMKQYAYGFELNSADLLGANEFISPIYIMSTVSMEEKFGPIIGVRFAMKSGFSGSFEWNLERKSGLNLSNLQVAEANSTDFVASAGYKKNNVKLPMRGRDGNQIVLKNDFNFNLSVAIRDLKIIQRRIDAPPVAIQGNYMVQIRPQVQYQFNKRFTGTFYVERLVNDPFTSLSFVRRSTIGGINVRFNLSD